MIVASAEEGVAKPDKRIFEIALDKANCEPQAAVMIGDRVDNDIVPAKALGMKTIWVKQGFGKYWKKSSESEQADYEVERLAEILEICYFFFILNNTLSVGPFNLPYSLNHRAEISHNI